MVRSIHSIVILLFIAHCIFGQTFFIKGSVKNAESKNDVGEATITLKSKADSVSVMKMVSDTSGRFIMTGLVADTFNIEITAVNFTTLLQRVVVAGADVNLGILERRQVSEVLKGVTVTSNISPVTQKGDSNQINANNYKVNPVATFIPADNRDTLSRRLTDQTSNTFNASANVIYTEPVNNKKPQKTIVFYGLYGIAFGNELVKYQRKLNRLLL